MSKAFFYQLRVRNPISAEWTCWFNGLMISPAGNNETLLSGVLVDQAALHGVLAKIRDLNLELISIQRVEGDNPQIQDT